MRFAGTPLGISPMMPDGIEVAEQDGADGGTAVNEVLHDFFVNLLGVAVGAFCLLDGSFLGDGEILGVGLTIDGAGRREDDSFHAILGHEFEEVDERNDVVFIVHQRFLHALADSLRGSEVDDALNAGVFLEDTFQSGEVAAIDFFKGGTNARNLFDAIHHVCF